MDSAPLAGLRRLVEHSRNLLIKEIPLNAGTAYFTSLAHRWHAELLAVQVLQLVADCIDDSPGAVDGEVVVDTDLPPDWHQKLARARYDQIKAAANLHKPAQWNAEYCSACREPDGEHLLYPCPTMQALQGTEVWS